MTTFGSDLILARLHRLHPKSIDLSLGRIERLLAALGHPETRLSPVVHVAGTNGKGSVLAILDAILTAAGARVQRYVSPHLVRFNERILLEGRPIEDTELAAVLDRAEEANGVEPITFFEITTAAAFLAFAERPADWLLLETGLGGRLDATNVASPRLTALTPISLDHQGFLGDNIPAIAFEKAGILKPLVPCVVGPQPAEALEVIARRAAELSAPLIVHGRDFAARRAGDRLRFHWRGEDLDLPLPAPMGGHQIDNAAIALALAFEFGIDAPEALARGLEHAHWPGRLQRLQRGPLVELLPESVELWLDGGHNPAAGEALAASFAADAKRCQTPFSSKKVSDTFLPLHLVVGMLSTKDCRGFLRPFAGRARSLVAVPVPDEALSFEPAVIASAGREAGLESGTAPDVKAALEAIAARETGPARILICGSLYLAGHVLRDNG